MNSYIISILGMAGLVVLWYFVQFGWAKTFRDDMSDDDPLAGRSDCSGCGCSGICQNKKIS